MQEPSGKVLRRGVAPNRGGFSYPIRTTANLFDPDQTDEVLCLRQIYRAVAQRPGRATRSRLAGRIVGQRAPIRSNRGPL